MKFQDKLEKLVNEYERRSPKPRDARADETPESNLAGENKSAQERPNYDLSELQNDVDQLIEASRGHVEPYELFQEEVAEDTYENVDDSVDERFSYHVGIKLVAGNSEFIHGGDGPTYYWRIAAHEREWWLLEYNYNTKKFEKFRYKRKGNLWNRILRRLAPLMCE